MRIIEFAWYFNGFFGSEVNTQGKTFSELTRGQETLDKMKEKTKTIYWIKENAHYMAYADSCLVRIPVGLFDFIPKWDCQSGVFQDFDPFRDIVTEPKGEVYNDTQVKLPYYLGI